MAKYFDPSDETIKLVRDAMSSTGLEQKISAKVIVNDEQKKEVIKVKKYTEEDKFVIGDDIRLCINELILDQLPEDMQKMCIEEALTGVYFDPDNDKLTVSRPDFIVHSGMISKYTFDTCNKYKESVKSLYDTKQNTDSQDNAE